MTGTNSHSAHGQTEPGEHRVLLCLEHTENERHLRAWFEEESPYSPEVVTDTDTKLTGDLCLVDRPALIEHRDWLYEQKTRNYPQFFPILLAQPDDNRSLGDDLWDVIDETISTPVDTDELRHRLENLLERRNLSNKLAQELETTEEYYKAVFQATNDAILIINPEADQVVDANLEAADILGYTQSEMESVTPTEDLHPTNTVEYMEFLEKVRTTGFAQTDNLTCTKSDGSEIEAEISASTIVVGEQQRAILSIRDVTERREQQRQLTQQRDQLERLNRITRTLHETTRAVVEASTQDELEEQVCRRLEDSQVYRFAWIGRQDEGNLVTARTASADAKQYLDHVTLTTDETDTGQGPTGRALSSGEVTTVQNVEEAPVMEPWRDALAQFDVQATAAVPIHHDGEKFGVLNLYTSREDAFKGDETQILEDLGRTIGRAIIGIQAREDAQLFRQAVEHAGHAIYITDTDGTIRYVNPTFEEVTGYESEDIIGERPSRLKSGEHSEEFYQNLWNTVLSGDIWENEIVNRRKDGRRQYIDQTIAPIVDEDGEPTHFVAVNNEITAQRRQRQQLEVLYRVLRHNLRNELNVIRGYAELLHETSSTDTQEAIANVSESIDDLLQLSRQARQIESIFGDEETENRFQQFEAVIQNAITSADPPTSALSTTIPETSYQVGIELEKAITELVQNAVTHTDSDEPTISVTAETTVEDGTPWGLITVQDNGPGIPTTERRVLREGEETPLLHGSGLGLWFVNWIVSELGGHIEIEDNEPRGSVVTVSVPLSEAQT
ncbi:PAS domain S-box protein [Salarchaeum sp. JOR-1]|uniref:PAS domain S-box protein n=1 Tax=Salarchaeum sp. JOR-1 TaxID=2599399 RepID=UPI001198AA36|nr:PAS domain S-box protein [Salarchaeum sp. JOR-1]QDX40517.1 PAS domain S-box protein [Salarchaeum sp. JOR-1]